MNYFSDKPNPSNPTGDEFIIIRNIRKHMTAVTEALIARRKFCFIQDDGTRLSENDIAELVASVATTH